MLRSPPTYSTGTVTGTINTNQLIGVGTNWITTDANGEPQSNVAAFDDLQIPGQRQIAILSVDDDQHITLAENLPFGIPMGSAYAIIRRTVSPALATAGALQKLWDLGTDKSPLVASFFDDGTTGRVEFGFVGGKFAILIGPSGTDPTQISLTIDPATGNVSAKNISSGGASSGGNTFYFVQGQPPNTLGNNGDLNFDFLSGGFVVYRKQTNQWSGGLDIFAELQGAVSGQVAAAQNASAAAQSSAALAAGWSSTAEDTDVPNAPAGSRSAFNFASKAAKAYAATQALIAGGGLVAYSAAQNLTDAQKAQAKSNIGAIGNEDGCCYLSLRDSKTLQLMPEEGNRLMIGPRSYTVPDAGLTIAPTTTSVTTFLVYAYADGTGALQIEAVTTPRAAGALGQQIKSGDASRRFLGLAQWNGSGFDQVLSWFRRRKLVRTGGFSNVQTSSTSATLLYYINFLAFDGMSADVSSDSFAILGSAQIANLLLKADTTLGAALAGLVGTSVSGAAGAYVPLSLRWRTLFSGDGFHSLGYFGSVNTGNQAAFYGNLRAESDG